MEREETCTHRVAREAGVLEALVEQRAVRQVLDARGGPAAVLKAHRVAHLLSQLHAHLLCHAPRHRHGGHAPRLRDGDHAAVVRQPRLQQNLRTSRARVHTDVVHTEASFTLLHAAQHIWQPVRKCTDRGLHDTSSAPAKSASSCQSPSRQSPRRSRAPWRLGRCLLHSAGWGAAAEPAVVHSLLRRALQQQRGQPEQAAC